MTDLRKVMLAKVRLFFTECLFLCILNMRR